MKDMWRGAFNLNKEVSIEYAWTNSELQARFIMCRRIARKKGIHPSVVFGQFDGSHDNYRIQKEIEIDEETT